MDSAEDERAEDQSKTDPAGMTGVAVEDAAKKELLCDRRQETHAEERPEPERVQTPSLAPVFRQNLHHGQDIRDATEHTEGHAKRRHQEIEADSPQAGSLFRFWRDRNSLCGSGVRIVLG